MVVQAFALLADDDCQFGFPVDFLQNNLELYELFGVVIVGILVIWLKCMMIVVITE